MKGEDKQHPRQKLDMKATDGAVTTARSSTRDELAFNYSGQSHVCVMMHHYIYKG